MKANQARSGNANFCVGQVLTFSTNWSHLPQGIQSRSSRWSFDGNFVNDSNQPSSDASINYTNNPAKLTNETASAWWISGGFNPSATYTARLTESITLSNGSFMLLSAKGLFSVLRPLPAFTGVIRDEVRVDTNNWYYTDTLRPQSPSTGADGRSIRLGHSTRWPFHEPLLLRISKLFGAD